jgi:hypothetical protein
LNSSPYLFKDLVAPCPVFPRLFFVGWSGEQHIDSSALLGELFLSLSSLYSVSYTDASALLRWPLGVLQNPSLSLSSPPFLLTPSLSFLIELLNILP